MPAITPLRPRVKRQAGNGGVSSHLSMSITAKNDGTAARHRATLCATLCAVDGVGWVGKHKGVRNCIGLPLTRRGSSTTRRAHLEVCATEGDILHPLRLPVNQGVVRPRR